MDAESTRQDLPSQRRMVPISIPLFSAPASFSRKSRSSKGRKPMSRLVSLTLALLLLSGCFALPFSVFPAAAQGQTAEITLSSFGGGPTYSVAVQDPEIVRCTFETTHDSDAPGAAVITVVTLMHPRSSTRSRSMTISMSRSRRRGVSPRFPSAAQARWSMTPLTLSS